MTETLALRPAACVDAYALWVWANDPETRRMSHGRPAIPWIEHVRWLDRVLDDQRTVALVAEAAGRCPVGWVRIETNDNWSTARVSYVIAPEARGRRLGRTLLSLGVGAALAARPDLVLWADVIGENPKSLHLFRRLGWEEATVADGAVRFVRRRGVSA